VKNFGLDKKSDTNWQKSVLRRINSEIIDSSMEKWENTKIRLVNGPG
jgi:hypothetical protein